MDNSQYAYPLASCAYDYACVWRITNFPKNQQFATHTN